MAGRPRKNIFGHLDHYLKCPAIVEKESRCSKKEKRCVNAPGHQQWLPTARLLPCSNRPRFLENNRATIPHFLLCDILLENQMIINY